MNYGNPQFLIPPLKWVSTGFSVASNRLTGRPRQTPTYVRTGSDARLWKYNIIDIFSVARKFVFWYILIFIPKLIVKSNTYLRSQFLLKYFFIFWCTYFKEWLVKLKIWNYHLLVRYQGWNFSAKYRIFEWYYFLFFYCWTIFILRLLNTRLTKHNSNNNVCIIFQMFL